MYHSNAAELYRLTRGTGDAAGSRTVRRQLQIFSRMRVASTVAFGPLNIRS